MQISAVNNTYSPFYKRVFDALFGSSASPSPSYMLQQETISSKMLRRRLLAVIALLVAAVGYELIKNMIKSIMHLYSASKTSQNGNQQLEVLQKQLEEEKSKIESLQEQLLEKQGEIGTLNSELESKKQVQLVKMYNTNVVNVSSRLGITTPLSPFLTPPKSTKTSSTKYTHLPSYANALLNHSPNTMLRMLYTPEKGDAAQEESVLVVNPTSAADSQSNTYNLD